MKRFAPVLVVLACVLPGSGCPRIDTTHVLYLSPAGAVTWTVREHDVHDLAAYRLVLTDGRFVSAEGFAIAPDGRTATFIEPAAPSGGQWLLSLTWAMR